LNNQRRDSLRDVLRQLRQCQSTVSRVLDKEQECYDNIPESLQDTESYERREQIIDALDEAVDKISEAIENIDDAVA